MTFNRKHALLPDLKSYRKKGVNTTKIICNKGDDPVKCKGSKGEIMYILCKYFQNTANNT